MKANSNFLAYAIFFSVSIAMSFTGNIRSPSGVSFEYLGLSEPLCAKLTGNIHEIMRAAKVNELLENFSGKLRSYVNRTSFDHLKFASQTNELNDDFQVLKEKMDSIISPIKIIDSFKLTKNMFLVMKNVANLRDIFDKSPQPGDAWLYRIYEIEVILFRLSDMKGNLNTQFDGHLQEIFGQIISSTTLERDYKSLIGPISFEKSEFKPQHKKVRSILQAFLLQVPKEEFAALL